MTADAAHMMPHKPAEQLLAVPRILRGVVRAIARLQRFNTPSGFVRVVAAALIARRMLVTTAGIVPEPLQHSNLSQQGCYALRL
eukprot:513439-Prymnesium_polylepis.1